MTEQKEPLSSVLTLSLKKQLAFALLVFERMLPSLIIFSEETGFDDSCYLQAKDAAWAALQNDAVDQKLNRACLECAPDTERFSHNLTSYALNAALAIGDIVDFTLDGGEDHIKYVLTLARDSIHLYVSSLEPSVLSSTDRNLRSARHPLMQEEQRREEDDARFLSGLPDQFDNSTISVLRARASSQPPLLPSNKES